MVRVMCLTLAVSVAIGISAASAQTDGKVSSRLRSITGVVKAVSASSLILERGGNLIMAIGVDSSTRVVGKMGARPRDLLFRGRGSRLRELVKPGDQVAVTYRQSGDAMNAVEVRIVVQR